MFSRHFKKEEHKKNHKIILDKVLFVKCTTCKVNMKLNFNGMAFLVTELTKSEMWAIYLMGFEREMPDKVTKADLVRIIRVLCRKLDWIEMDHAEALTQKSGNKFF